LGVHARPAQNAWQPGIDQVREYLRQERVHFLPHLKSLRREFTSYRRTERWAQADDDPKSRPDTEGDHHLLDCLRYLCMERPIRPQVTLPEPGPLSYETLLRQYRGPGTDFVRPLREGAR
jgi:hypothetical protein